MSRFPCQRIVTAGDLVAEIGHPARLVGEAARRIDVLASLGAASEGALCFIKADDPAPGQRLETLSGISVVLADDAAVDPALLEKCTLIHVPDPRRYYIRAFRLLVGTEAPSEAGVASGAFVHPDAKLGPNVLVGHGASIAAGVCVGADCMIMAGVHIYEGTRIGAGVLIQANTVVGSVGQSYEREKDGTFLLMPHLAEVVIEDGVRIGTNSTIVRGTLQDTVIGAATIVGNHVNIGHNVTIGRRCHIGAGAIICGSSRLADDCWISPGVTVRSVAVGQGSMVGAGALVTRPVEAGKFVTGVPAREAVRANAYNQRTGR
jgi:UDP-3-O-[3-hydroxymyristoyl] glucosamine N-acyltransferase